MVARRRIVLNELIDEAIELKRDGDEIAARMKEVKAKLRNLAQRKLKDGESMVSFDGNGGKVKVTFPQVIKLEADLDEVLRTLGMLAEQVFEIDREPKIKVPKDFAERLEALADEDAVTVQSLTSVKPGTPKVEIQAVKEMPA